MFMLNEKGSTLRREHREPKIQIEEMTQSCIRDYVLASRRVMSSFSGVSKTILGKVVIRTKEL